jgi:hypothetical protein
VVLRTLISFILLLITNYPERYPWSSYKYYLKPQIKLQWLFRYEILNRFENIAPINGYRKFVMEGIKNKEENLQTSKGYPYAFEKLLKSSITQPQQVPMPHKEFITIETIISIVAEYFNMNPDKIKK